MSETTIEWTSRRRADGSRIPGYTFNHIRGCCKISKGCQFCYAETLSKRNPKALGMWGPSADRVVAAESYWKKPLQWNEEAKEARERRMVFCASLADVFEGPETCQDPEVYTKVQAARERLFDLALRTNWLDWLFLTKRPENIKPILQFLQHPNYPHTDLWTLQERQPRPNWWFGTSVEDQDAADKRIPELLQVPAVVRFLSCEPLLGPVDLTDVSGARDCTPDHIDCLEGVIHCSHGPVKHASIHWVIAGGESGGGARPMHPDWARGLRDQCQEAGIPFFFKQWGQWKAIYDRDNDKTPSKEFLDHEKPPKREGRYLNLAGGHGFHGQRVHFVEKVGVKKTGRLLDGWMWDEFPAPFPVQEGIR